MSTRTTRTIVYPESDGKPLADNTLQADWIVLIKTNLDILHRDDPAVFVAMDLFWYPVEGEPKVVFAPDVMVAFGRPKGYRGSYLQWAEDRVAPQVVFEILSPKNTRREMARKLAFYDRFGVEEYYEFDPYKIRLRVWTRRDDQLAEIPQTNGWISPRLGIRFELGADMTIYRPDGQPFETTPEISRQRDEFARQRDDANRKAEEARRRADRMAELLRSMGIDPDE